MKTLSILIILSFICVHKTFAQNHAPVAVNDTVYGFFNYPNQVHLLQNDYDPDGDSIFVAPSADHITKINDTTWEFQFDWRIQGYVGTQYTYGYRIKDINGSNAYAKIVFIPKAPLRYDSLDINNINAWISPVGQHFWGFETAHFEVPKGAGKGAVFNHALWMAGIDAGNQLHFAGERYRVDGADFFQGPISTLRDSTFAKKWNRVWNITKKEIQYHINNYSNVGYQPNDVIKNWPAHGDVSLGQTANIAPFYDLDHDGVYKPSAGDHPLIRGDETVFFVLNDSANIHSESKGDKLGIEIHAMAYAFDKPNDSLLFNTIFFHYDIVNRSQRNYHDTYLGLFADFDLGYARDDYVGSDIKNGMAYAYNGDSIDQDWTGSNGLTHKGYGVHPPAIGLKVIGGPYMPDDGIDNPKGGCDNSINGLNFGDNIVDNERFGMTNFVYFNNSGSGYMTDPSVAIEYYDFMKGTWKDGTQMVFGGNGHIVAGGVGPECNFMFPGNTDTLCNWGTNGALPNGGYNQNGFFWNEATTGNAPDDRRGLPCIGPFTINAGQSIPLDYCFTFARDYTGDNLSSVELLQDLVSTITTNPEDYISLPSTYFSINEQAKTTKLSVLPNPAQDWIIVVSEEKAAQSFLLYDYSGKLVLEGKLKTGKTQINIQSLKPGVYLLRSTNTWARFVKM
ncbi:MAG: T9SS type A sorting domain-containing protein [Bacteroidales bacterium]